MVEQVSFHVTSCNQCFRSGSGLDTDSIGSTDPDSGRPKLSPQKRNSQEISCLKSLNVLCRDLGRHM
jgi:hypothetical protein